jgi:hypothetical protein
LENEIKKEIAELNQKNQIMPKPTPDKLADLS